MRGSYQLAFVGSASVGAVCRLFNDPPVGDGKGNYYAYVYNVAHRIIKVLGSERLAKAYVASFLPTKVRKLIKWQS